MYSFSLLFFFFFQAEDGIRDYKVTGVQTCALPICVFATTPPYFDYNWTVRGDLDPALVKKLTDAFLALDPAKPEHKAILELQRAARFVPTQASNYEGIEAAAKSAGLLK